MREKIRWIWRSSILVSTLYLVVVFIWTGFLVSNTLFIVTQGVAVLLIVAGMISLAFLGKKGTRALRVIGSILVLFLIFAGWDISISSSLRWLSETRKTCEDLALSRDCKANMNKIDKINGWRFQLWDLPEECRGLLKKVETKCAK